MQITQELHSAKKVQEIYTGPDTIRDLAYTQHAETKLYRCWSNNVRANITKKTCENPNKCQENQRLILKENTTCTASAKKWFLHGK